jgi:hypothetical protein
LITITFSSSTLTTKFHGSTPDLVISRSPIQSLPSLVTCLFHHSSMTTLWLCQDYKFMGFSPLLSNVAPLSNIDYVAHGFSNALASVLISPTLPFICIL